MKCTNIILVLFALVLVTLSSRAQTSSKEITKKFNRKMVFSGSEIKPGSENESSFITNYQPGDELFYRVYLDSTFKQYIDKWRYFTSPLSKFKFISYQFFIDDKYTGQYIKKLGTIADEDFKNTSSFGSCMFTSSDCSDPYSMNNDFKTFLNAQASKLKGDHVLKIKVFMFDNQFVYELYATGTLNIKSNEASMVKAAGISGEFHKSHLKKMVFSSKPVGEEPNQADLITQYTIGQPLYYRVFMDNTIANYRTKYQYASSYKDIYLKFYVDGTQIKEDSFKDFSSLNLTDEQISSLTSFAGIVMSDKTVDWQNEKFSILWPFDNFLINNNKMLTGTHKLKIEVYLYAQGVNLVSELLGEGELSLSMGSISKTHPILCYTPTAVMSDPALEAKFIEVYNEEFTGKAVATRAYIMFKDWDVVKNEYTGAILCKVRSANMQVKTSDGSCMYAEVSFKMDYEGAGKYGRIQFGNLITGGYHPVLCECGK